MTQFAADGPNAAQITYWNEGVGPVWVAMNDALDHSLRSLGLKAMEVLAPRPGERLLDIGCGCGDTALELARRVGEEGGVLGADISAPMLEVARRRAEAAGLAQTTFVQADAQSYAFEPIDAAFSRFGVMFFADPVAAFTNIRAALKPGGRVAFVCWRPLSENPWMTVPANAVLPLLPAPPKLAPPNAPGPYAFADRDYLLGVLTRAGFADISIQPHDAKIGWGDLGASVRTALSVGPVAMALRENPDLRDAITAAVHTALATHASPDGVLLESATWIVRAS
jgi:SAM-dependent methyltransferase